MENSTNKLSTTNTFNVDVPPFVPRPPVQSWTTTTAMDAAECSPHYGGCNVQFLDNSVDNQRQRGRQKCFPDGNHKFVAATSPSKATHVGDFSLEGHEQCCQQRDMRVHTLLSKMDDHLSGPSQTFIAGRQCSLFKEECSLLKMPKSSSKLYSDPKQSTTSFKDKNSSSDVEFHQIANSFNKKNSDPRSNHQGSVNRRANVSSFVKKVKTTSDSGNKTSNIPKPSLNMEADFPELQQHLLLRNAPNNTSKWGRSFAEVIKHTSSEQPASETLADDEACQLLIKGGDSSTCTEKRLAPRLAWQNQESFPSSSLGSIKTESELGKRENWPSDGRSKRVYETRGASRGFRTGRNQTNDRHGFLNNNSNSWLSSRKETELFEDDNEYNSPNSSSKWRRQKDAVGGTEKHSVSGHRNTDYGNKGLSSEDVTKSFGRQLEMQDEKIEDRSGPQTKALNQDPASHRIAGSALKQNYARGRTLKQNLTSRSGVIANEKTSEGLNAKHTQSAQREGQQNDSMWHYPQAVRPEAESLNGEISTNRVSLYGNSPSSGNASVRVPHAGKIKDLDTARRLGYQKSCPPAASGDARESAGASGDHRLSCGLADSPVVEQVPKKKKKKSEGQLKREFKNKLKALPSVQGKVLTITHDFYQQYNRDGRTGNSTPTEILGSFGLEEFPALGTGPCIETRLDETNFGAVDPVHDSDDSWSDIEPNMESVPHVVDEFPDLKLHSTTQTKIGDNKKILALQSPTLPVNHSVTDLKEDVAVPAAKHRPKATSLIQFDLLQLIVKKKGSGATKDARKGKVKPVVANILDSSAPRRRRGKEREQPHKKKPTAMKKIILRERMEKKINKEALLHPVELLTPKLEELSIADDIQVLKPVAEISINIADDNDAAKYLETTLAPDLQLPSLPAMATPQTAFAHPGRLAIHNRRFREYCDQMLNPEIDEVVTKMLQDLIRFHDRIYQKDPIKAKMRRRMVLGFREVTKHLKLKKIKCLILAPNVEKIKSSGGLDDAMNTLITLAREQNVPFVFALGRRKLGYVTLKKVPVSCVGVFNYDGTENSFKELCTLAEVATDAYRQAVEQIDI